MQKSLLALLSPFISLISSLVAPILNWFYNMFEVC